MILYGHPASTCTRKVLTTLAEKNATFELYLVDLAKGDHKHADHLARQPFGQVPAIDHDGFKLYESRAIIRYLDEVLAGPALTPASAQGRARMEQWMSVETSNFTPGAMKIIYQVVFGRARGHQVDMDKVQEGRTLTGKALDVLERGLEHHPYLAGEAFSLADLCYMPYLEYLEVGGEGALMGSRPNVAAWWARIRSRPSWQHVIAHRG